MKTIDMTGYKTGLITVVRREGSKKGQTTWLCQCECGKTFVQYGGPLRKGKVKSCGHIYADKKARQEIAYRTIAKQTHGGSRSRLYFVWQDMKNRCNKPTDVSYKNYGARGIKVCDEWLNDFSAFQKWAFETGYNPSAKRNECTLDRMDINGDYRPNNCRWLDGKGQCANRRNSYTITYNGETHSASEWSTITGVERGTIYRRYKAGKTPEEILSKEDHRHHKKDAGGR